jgi:hypothetical protein
VADRLDVAAFQGCLAEILDVESAIPALFRVSEIKLRRLEHGVVAVDGEHVELFPPPVIKSPQHSSGENSIIIPSIAG